LKTEEGEENDPQRNPKGNYIGQNRGKEEINLVAQLKARYQRKEDNVKRQSTTRSSPDRTQQG